MRTAAAALLLLGFLPAQDKSNYPTQLHPERFSIDWKAFYERADEMTAATRKVLPHHLDIPYGRDPKQKLDLYLPSVAPTGPVFLFIHGGGFVEGDRAHYGYVGRPLAPHGFLTVVMSYRLEPAHYPAQAEDTAAALEWVYRNIARYGGDPERIFIGGHSAGAILSAFVSVGRDAMRSRSLPETPVKGFLPVSGPYDLRDFGSFVNVYLPEPELREEASPALQIADGPPPAVVVYGEKETHYAAPSRDFVEELRKKGGTARVLVLEGMDHDGTALALGYEESPLTRVLVDLMKAK